MFLGETITLKLDLLFSLITQGLWVGLSIIGKLFSKLSLNMDPKLRLGIFGTPTYNLLAKKKSRKAFKVEEELVAQALKM